GGWRGVGQDHKTISEEASSRRDLLDRQACSPSMRSPPYCGPGCPGSSGGQ
ncbi:hypothetical protein fugu_016068, partial [Takifugu bimaculatus]